MSREQENKLSLKLKEMKLNVDEGVLKNISSKSMREMLKLDNRHQMYAVLRLLQNKMVIENNKELEYIRLIESGKCDFHAIYVGRVLNDEFVNRIDKGSDYAKILLESKEEFQAQAACNVLTDINANRADIASVGANIIIKYAKLPFQAREASLILTDSVAIALDVALEGALIVTQLDEEIIAVKVRETICDGNVGHKDLIADIVTSLENYGYKIKRK